MRRTLTIAAVVLAVILTTTHTQAHEVYVKGIDGPGHAGEIAPDAAICLLLDPVATETDLNGEVRGKLERMLAEQGYRVTAKDDADYLLFYDFQRETFTTRIKLEPLSGHRSGMATTPVEGPYDLTLSLRLVSKQSYTDEGMGSFAWAGGAALHTAHTESPRFTNILLVAALKHFLVNTDEVVTEKIGLYNRTASKLEKP